MTMPIGPTGGFWIESSEVRKAGKTAHDIAKALPGDVKKLYKPCDAASDGLIGWQTAGAVTTCVDAWAKAVKSLAGMVETTGDKLIAAADGYKGQDHHQGTELDQLYKQLGQGRTHAGER
ncbi:type VII secretion target [Streptomyces varsoviensis]|uniref:type VII secretion target n=1 Tax=Streptomyces varsoviensis TaxID=67373 RepID=UPI003408B36A